jgi:parvulin-like peptidyl-prolyl isomerase
MKPSLLIAAALVAASLAVPDVAGAQTLGGGRRDPSSAADAPARPPMSPDTVLAESGGMKVTRRDYDIELLRLPPDIRGGFATSEKRVADLLTRMLLTKQLAALAESTGQMADPVNAARLASEIERYKAQVMIARYEAEAAARFDADRSRWEIRARDVYLAESRRFEMPEGRMLARLTVRVAPRGGVDPAMQAAQDLRRRWMAGEPYEKLALETDDGKLAAMDKPKRYGRGDLPADVAEPVFALPDGAVSEPLVVGDEVHVIRVVERVPAGKKSFDDAKPEILRELKQRYIDTERSRILGGYSDVARAGIRTEIVDPMVLKVDEATIDRLHREALTPGAASKQK